MTQMQYCTLCGREGHYPKDCPLSPKVQNFIKELENLCNKHQVCLAVSGHDALQIWNLEEGDEPIHSRGIEDQIHERQNERTFIQLQANHVPEPEDQ